MNTTTHSTQRTPQYLSWNTLFWIGPLTILACVVVNIIVRAVAVTFFGVSASFQPLQPPTIIVSTVVYLLLAIVALLLVSRVSEHPGRAYRIVVSVCLLLSLLFPVMALAGIFPTSGMGASIFWSMVAMHVLSAAIVIVLLPMAITRR